MTSRQGELICLDASDAALRAAAQTKGYRASPKRVTHKVSVCALMLRCGVALQCARRWTDLMQRWLTDRAVSVCQRPAEDDEAEEAEQPEDDIDEMKTTSGACQCIPRQRLWY